MRLWIVGTLLITLSSLLSAGDAARGYELYSWQRGGKWRYAILEGTPSSRTTESIRAMSVRLKDLNHLKGRIASLSAGETLYWRVDKARGFLLPPLEIVRDVNRYASGAQILLFLPGQNRDSKVLEQLQDEVQQLTD